MFKLFLIVSLVLGVLSVTHVEPERSVQSISIRLGERVQINYPSFPFHDVYERDIKRYPDDKREFSIENICKQDPSRLLLNSLSFFDLKPPRPRKTVLYELEDIQNTQSVVDAIIGNDRAYVAFKNATIAVLQASPNGTLALVGLWDLNYDGQVNIGQFIQTKSGNEVLFITDLKLYSVTGNKPILINGYRSSSNFSSALFIQDRYFAVAQGPLGIVIYQYSGPKQDVKYLTTIGSGNINRMNFHFQDLAYDGKSTLFMLDRNFGLIMNKIKIENGKVTLDPQPQVVKKRNCDNIVYSEGDIYMTCNNVYRYGVHTDSIESQLPDPLFKVKELYSYGSMLVIMGENDFKVYHNDKLVDDIEMEAMDKFLLNKNQYLAVNEFGIKYGNYSIKQPVISCQADQTTDEGIYNVIVTLEAECNPQYFSKRSLQLKTSKNQTCLYTTPVQLLFWGPKSLSIVPIYVIIIIFGVFGVGLISWVVTIRKREEGLRLALKGFHPAGSKQSYDVMVDEIVPQESRESREEKEEEKDVPANIPEQGSKEIKLEEDPQQGNEKTNE